MLTVSFKTCTLDDTPIPLEESRNYKNLVKFYGLDIANQYVVEFEVELGGDP